MCTFVGSIIIPDSKTIALIMSVPVSNKISPTPVNKGILIVEKKDKTNFSDLLAKLFEDNVIFFLGRYWVPFP